MNRKFLFSALVVIVMLLAACSPGASEGTQEATSAGGIPVTGETPSAAYSTSVSTEAATAPATTGTSMPSTGLGTPSPSTSGGTVVPPSGTAAGTPAPLGTTTSAVPVTGNALCPTSPTSGGASGTPAMATGTAAPATGSTGSSSNTAPSGPAQVNICWSSIFGDYLVDANGMTLYAYAKDQPNSNASNCDGACATSWPPFLTQGTPVVGSSATAKDGTQLDSSMLGTITRSDGSTQVTFNGWPLYYFSGDKVPGDINGEMWFVMPPKGPAGSQQ